MQERPVELSISTPTHGRCLTVLRESPVVLAGFHGYGESAEDQLERLWQCPGSDRWSLVSVQGLNRFYQRRTRRVVAGWMTSQDRQQAISDNARYVAAALDQALSGRVVRTIVFAGFSQGVSMAFRAATTLGAGARHHVVAVGGDVPPELDAGALGHLSSVLVCRGRDDDRYALETCERDLARLDQAGVPAEVAHVPGGHAWSPEVVRAVGEFLNRMRV